MVKLIFKDLRISRDSYIMYAVLFFVVFELYSLLHLTRLMETVSNASSSMAICSYFIMFIIIQHNTFYMDSKNDSMLFVGSLPLKRYDIIKSKYMFMLGVLMLPMLLFIVNVIIQKSIHASIDADLLKGNFFVLVLALNVMLFLSAIQLPFFYLFNFKNAKNICSALSFILIFVCIFIFALFKGITFLDATDQLNTLNTSLTSKSLIFTSIFSGTLYIASIITSKKIFERKDL